MQSHRDQRLQIFQLDCFHLDKICFQTLVYRLVLLKKQVAENLHIKFRNAFDVMGSNVKMVASNFGGEGSEGV